MTNVIELYEIGDIENAIAVSIIRNKTMDFIRELDGIIDNDSFVLSIKPQFVTYLSGIYAESLPRITKAKVDENDINTWLSYIKEKRADYIILTTIKLSPAMAEIDVIDYLHEHADETISLSYLLNGEKHKVFSLLAIR